MKTIRNVAGLTLLLLLASCAAPLVLHLEAPAPASAGVYRDADVEVAFQGTTRKIAVTIKNLSDQPVFVHWGRGRFVDVEKAEHEVVALTKPTVAELRKAPAGVKIDPGGSWAGFVHPRDRARAGSGTKVAFLSFVDDEGAAAGKVIGLNLPIDVGNRPDFHEFRFRLKPGG